MTPHAELSACLRARRGAFTLDIELQTSGCVAVLGPNGAGKTTLLQALLGALPLERAVVTVGGTPLVDTERGLDTRVECRRFAYVPQGYALFPHMTVREHLRFAARCAQVTEARAVEIEAQFGLGSIAARRPAALSGGERQRLALARALVGQPRLVLLDEPLAALDLERRAQVREELAAMLASLEVPSLVVTHDPVEARALATRAIVLEAGRVSQAGTWAELAAAPATLFVHRAVAAAVELT